MPGSTTFLSTFFFSFVLTGREDFFDIFTLLGSLLSATSCIRPVSLLFEQSSATSASRQDVRREDRRDGDESVALCTLPSFNSLAIADRDDFRTFFFVMMFREAKVQALDFVAAILI
jgi:hypothetical protein